MLVSRTFAASLMACLTLAGASPAICASQSIVAVPTFWRLENYMGNNVVVWDTGAAGCAGRNLSFDTNASTDDRNRFWATVTTGKINTTPVFIYYDDQSCKIISFGLQEK